MKRTEAERLYEKYTKIGAKVEFKFNKMGAVSEVEITRNYKPGVAGWIITVRDLNVSIWGNLSLPMAEPIIDLLLTGKS